MIKSPKKTLSTIQRLNKKLWSFYAIILIWHDQTLSWYELISLIHKMYMVGHSYNLFGVYPHLTVVDLYLTAQNHSFGRLIPNCSESLFIPSSTTSLTLIKYSWKKKFIRIWFLCEMVNQFIQLDQPPDWLSWKTGSEATC